MSSQACVEGLPFSSGQGEKCSLWLDELSRVKCHVTHGGTSTGDSGMEALTFVTQDKKQKSH